MRTATTIIAAALLLALPLGVATAQYKWRDAAGGVHYSDLPPPPGVPGVQLPPVPPAPAPAKGAAASASSAPGKAARAPISFAPSGDKPPPDGARARACDNLRAEQRLLESGMRVASVDENGERAYLSDEDRARRLAELAADVPSVCGSD